MADVKSQVEAVLNNYFFRQFPEDVVSHLEKLPVDEVIPVVSGMQASVLAPVWGRLVPRIAAMLTAELPEKLAREVLESLAPNDAVRILGQVSDKESAAFLELLSPGVRGELVRLMSYPEGSAGRMMNTRVPVYRPSMRVAEAIDTLRRVKMQTARAMFLVDAEGHVSGRVLLQDLITALPDATLGSLSSPVKATVQALATQEEVADLFARNGLLDLPVIDINGVFLGVIVHTSMLQAFQGDSTADIQTMVGASREERALSKPLFAVKKRMPWLQINLLTAFLAASVVGIFEETIAQVTALAILMPVVAGQSGNTGQQALAVTMRGLALREISIRDWASVMFKEVFVALMNGLSIALTCGLGVYLWSGSVGLVAVIMLAMIIAMVVAGFAGAVVPISLVRLGQDPAQSSSIFLTMTTDITAFFTFLGIATLLLGFL